MNSAYKWLLFDADGTLFNYELAEVKALTKTFNDAGFHFDSSFIPIYRKINAQLWLDFEEGKIEQDHLKEERFNQLFQTLKIAENVDGFGEKYLLNLGLMNDLLEDAEEVLNILNKNFKLQLVTNGIKEVQRSRLARSPINKVFDSIIISGEIGVAKPDSRFFEYAFKSMNYPEKHEVLIIGDSLTSDILGGNNFGIDTCWFNSTHQRNDSKIKPCFTITKLQNLLPILGL